MIYDLVLGNATAVNWHGRSRCHIAVANGKIVALLDANIPLSDLQASKTIDCSGRFVIPGGVDGHCHVAQKTGPHLTTDTYESASKAALAGGTTTIIDFGIPATRDGDIRATLQQKLEQIPGSYCDVAMHGSVIRWTETTEDDLQWMWEHGVTSVKVYTTNRSSTYADSEAIVKTMKYLGPRGGLLYVHAEHNAIIEDAAATIGRRLLVTDLPDSRPKAAELASIREILGLAAYAGARTYFVHQSFGEAVRIIDEARRSGAEVYTESCPHYLVFDDSVYGTKMGAGFAGSPPLRSKEDRQEMIRMVAGGLVDTIGSDHSNFTWDQKERTEDLAEMPFGLPGVETRIPATYSAVCRDGGASVERFVDLISAAPARINSLKSKGVIGIGYDADLVVLADTPRTVNPQKLAMNSGWSPYQGRQLSGWPKHVIFSGEVVVDDGQFVAAKPRGKYRARS